MAPPKKASKKRRRGVDRGYEAGDEVLETRVKGRRATQERTDSLRRRWHRNQELQYDALKFTKFAKAVAGPKAKGMSRRQRRNMRRPKKGAEEVSDWPGKRALKEKAPMSTSWQDAAKELQLKGSSLNIERKEEEVIASSESDDSNSSKESGDEEEEAMPDIDQEDQDIDESNVVFLDDEERYKEESSSPIKKEQFEVCLNAEEVKSLQERIGPYTPIAMPGWSLSGNNARVPETVSSLKLNTDLKKPLQDMCTILSTWRDALIVTGAPAVARKSKRLHFLEAILAHVVNETIRSRSAVLKHDAKLRKHPDQEESRDQGLSRPRVLILSPLRGHALDIISIILNLVQPNAVVKGRPETELALAPHSQEKSDQDQKGPRDWEEVFGPRRNIDDDFELGLTITPGLRKKSSSKKKNNNNTHLTETVIGVTLDTPLSRSDIILASPAKMRSRLETEGSIDELSSLEICLIDAADVMLYQNWDFVLATLAALNRRPRLELPPSLDIRRVRLPELENQAKFCRQTIIVSSYADARLRAAIDAPGRDQTARDLLELDDHEEQDTFYARNRAGASRFSPPPISDDESALAVTISKLEARCRFVFRRLDGSTPASASDAKLNYFKMHLASKLKAQTLIFANTYHDFLACRSALRSAAVDFVSIHEYSRGSEISRARSNFYHSRVPVLLYSGRAHFYQRLRIRGATTTIFVSPPDLPVFFPELVTRMFDHKSVSDHMNQDDHDSLYEDPTEQTQYAVLLLFSRFDALAMERILGAARAKTAALAPTADDVFVIDADLQQEAKNDDALSLDRE